MRTGIKRKMGSKSIGILGAAVALALTAFPVLAQQRTLCVHGLASPQALKVHDGPGTNSRVIGRFEADACGVRLAGRCSGDWCQMALGNTKGWVDTRHIGVYEVPAGAKAAAAIATPASPKPAAPNKTALAETAPDTAGIGDHRDRSREPKISSSKPKPQRSARAPGVEQDGKADERRADEGACVTNVDHDDTLRIRKGPGVDHDEIGDLPPKACGVSISEKCRGDWCRIFWRGRKGWVNTNYLD